MGNDPHDPKHPYDEAACAKCGKAVSLRVAYIDEYIQPGKELYVHNDCLSAQQRRKVDGR